MLGSIGATAAPGNLTDTGALRFGVGPSISWGLFDMERIHARIRSAGSQAQAAGATWEATVLKAVEETDAALDGLAAARRAAMAAGEAAVTMHRLADLSQARQRTGQDSMIAASLSASRRCVPMPNRPALR